jgi:hypothetical protein
MPCFNQTMKVQIKCRNNTNKNNSNNTPLMFSQFFCHLSVSSIIAMQLSGTSVSQCSLWPPSTDEISNAVGSKFLEALSLRVEHPQHDGDHLSI